MMFEDYIKKKLKELKERIGSGNEVEKELLPLKKKLKIKK